MEDSKCYMNFAKMTKVWLKCKAKAERALNIVKFPPRDEQQSSDHHPNPDNSIELQQAPLMADQDTQQDMHTIKHDNTLRAPMMNERQFEHTRVHVETAEQLDMKDRDPTDMNKHVRVWFEEVLAEPEGMHSFDRVWRFSFVTFTTVKSWSYRFCTLLCGVPFAICWGVYFACLTFLHIWYVVPCIKSCLIVLHWASKLWTLCIRTFCDPCYESMAKIFSNIHLTSYRQ
ncbi:caveolin-3-like isoform X2 [Acanthaster planci]|uniref:Caveolin n=1 Tax=Acanthaster planci TaxID=133434 RepID=A0A8B7Y3H9_ACAPL|nr:caveolin-3-like isoform X2 [Acanthaster planci]